jgi:uncharacterized protein
MQHKVLHNENGQRTHAVVLETGEEVMGSLRDFVRKRGIYAAQITAIGALWELELRYFDWSTKKYHPIRVSEQVEVASMVGDVAENPKGEPDLHIHLVVGKKDGSAMAGHLGSATVRPTLELLVTESPAHLKKRHDPETGLALIRMDG